MPLTTATGGEVLARSRTNAFPGYLFPRACLHRDKTSALVCPNLTSSFDVNICQFHILVYIIIHNINVTYIHESYYDVGRQHGPPDSVVIASFGPPDPCSKSNCITS